MIISVKKRAYSSTPVGFPIRNDLRAYSQGISEGFPSGERARRAPIYVQAHTKRINSQSIHHIMKAILISIKPQYAAAIYTGIKTYELRKCQPNVEVGTPMLIYETSPIKRITGVAYYGGTIVGNPWRIWYKLRYALGIEYKPFMDYYKTDRFAYAWKLTHVRRLDCPMQLSDLNLSRPPQSYQFIDIPDNLIKIQ